MTLVVVPRRKRPVAERFWEKVDKRSSTECWAWTAYRNKRGYGYFSLDGSPTTAHRVAFWLTYGHMPEEVDHLCVNPSCANPQHLQDVSHAENARLVGVRRKTCLNGLHEWSGENIILRRSQGKVIKMCRPCKNANNKAWYRRQRRAN